MGTRGFIGFVAEGRETIVYNHWDSYPSGLGLDVLHFARSVTDWDAAKQQAAALVHIDPDVPPTEEQKVLLKRWEDPDVGGAGDGWYQLLRGTQGDPAAILAAGHAEHDPDWPGSSLFCEWGYLLDLDARVLEVYEGFQEEPHSAGRFADRPGCDGYTPVKLVASWPLRELPEDDALLACEN
ncbi:hypothetical protein DMA15_03870 [Streptomyces sp. WAC 01529]|uniref:hypothetical protein n=1 Tax=Streptomyces sp. WAC 01529 TaxID=2203205 RepID=UPI000F6F6D02|nr:hypothetical protein [Streptomyces sp. WAC 01529]AZM51831.1 hypothetical protein DMA15_03870 [Streptomyces sp. WAC 01529]